MKICPLCRANLELVGRVHRCVAVVTKPAVTKPPVTKVVVTKPTPVLRVVGVRKRGGRPPLGAVAMPGAERTRRWRSRVSGGGMC
jgi:hypothetical protein